MAAALSPPPTMVTASLSAQAWAIPIVGAIVVGGGSLAGVLGIVWMATTVGGSAFSCSGWVKGGTIFVKSEGQAWVLPGERPVVSVASPSSSF